MSVRYPLLSAALASAGSNGPHTEHLETLRDALLLERLAASRKL